MTAPTGPGENSHMNEEIPSSEHQGFIYDSPETPEPETPAYEANYEPEREFVLMPLFRRIGALLGIRRQAESGEIYTQPVPGERQDRVAVEPEPSSVADVANAELHEPAIAATQVQSEDILDLEPEIAAAPLTAQSEVEPQPPIFTPPVEPDRVPILRASEEPQIVPPSLSEEPEVVAPFPSNDVIYPQSEVPPPARFEPTLPAEAPPIVARSEVPRPAEVHRALTQDDIKELVAPIREAAVSISVAISQAAEWLHNKEEEILRRAEAIGAQASEMRKHRPHLVDKPRGVPFWKRIDWEKEFTPGRAAILGAVAMAVLMVLGISLARRPASSVLPQQQTHAIQPGGVTLTAHPTVAASRSSSLQSQHQTARPAHSAAPAPHRAHRMANDDSADVVTHYYGNKSKPSPTHQSTIAGVRHYSDMQ